MINHPEEYVHFWNSKIYFSVQTSTETQEEHQVSCGVRTEFTLIRGGDICI